MLQWKLFRLLQVFLAFLLFFNAGPRQIVETLQGTAVPVSTHAAQPHQFDALLRELQTAVSHPSPQPGHIQQLQQQLIAEHDNVLAQLQQQADLLVELHVPDEIVARTETAVTTYQTHYATLMHLLDKGDVAGVAAFLAETLPSTAVPNIPQRTLPQIDTPARTAVEASTARPHPSKTLSAPTDDPPNADDLAETIEIQFTPDITQLAADLNHNPIEIYNWVHNNIAFTPVWGSIQGAQHCLETRTCNAFDTSSLLAALLRVSGIPARYQMGSVDVPIDQFMNWAGGFSSPEAAASLFASAGVPDVVRRVNGGSVVSVRLQHVWVKAYVDFIPSRGAVYNEGDTWIPLDGAFKQYSFPPPADWAQFLSPELGDPTAFWDQLLATAVIDPNTGSLTSMDTSLIANAVHPDEDTLYNYFSTNYPDASLADLIGRKRILSDTIPILPASLPYTILNQNDPISEIPNDLRHRLQITLLDAAGNPQISYDRALPELAGKRMTLAYEPATTGDADTIEAYWRLGDDLPYVVPAGLANMRPKLVVDGGNVAVGTAVPIGQMQQLQIAFTAPTISTPIVTNDIIAGEIAALGLNVEAIAPSLANGLANRLTELADELLNNPEPVINMAELQRLMLHANITNWFTQADLVNGLFADATGAVTLRYPSLGIAFTNYAPNTLFGAPSDLFFNGVGMDIDRDIVVTLAKDGDQQTAVHHTIVTGMIGSQLEADLPTTYYYPWEESDNAHWLATSSTLASAIDLDDTMVAISSENYAQVAPSLHLSSAELTELENALNAGLIVFLHQTPLVDQTDTDFTAQLWLDPLTGSANYLISGLGGAEGANCGEFVDNNLINGVFSGGLVDATSTFGGWITEKLSGKTTGNVAGKVLSLVGTIHTFMGNQDKALQAMGQLGESARPLLGLAFLFAALDVIKTFAISGNIVGAAAGAYLNVVSWTAYKEAAYIIGRLAEIEAASNGIILPPGCLAKRVFPS